MEEGINSVITTLSCGLGESLRFFIGVCLISAAFIVHTLLQIFTFGYSERKRKWYILFSLGVIAWEYGAILFSEGNKAYVFYLITLFILSLIPENYVRGREKEDRQNKLKKDNKESLKLARFIDEEIKKSATVVLPEIEEDEKRKGEIGTEEKRKAERNGDFIPEQSGLNDQLNYSHVKSVMSRLDYFGLNTVERKQIKELEILINRAENGEKTKEIKREINDGLGALLKIMSKYGA